MNLPDDISAKKQGAGLHQIKSNLELIAEA
jgi:hypothetical protein